MADFGDDILEAIRDVQTETGQTATYTRGSDSVSVSAVLGQDEFPRESREGLTTEERTVDFLIVAADLILDSVTVEPEPGDSISVSGLGTFEVKSPGGSEPAWRYTDQYRRVLRIHTREV